MKLDIRTNQVLYIEIDEWTFCIDNSTDEQLVSKWLTNDMDKSFKAEWLEE